MTIKDIAKRCGVSVSTVSRVLNHYPDVSDDMREKILGVMRELDYVPNSSASDLRRVRSDAIGLIVRGVGNPFFTGVIHAMGQAIEEAGYTMVLRQIRSGEDELRTGAELARAKRLRGLILLGGCFDYSEKQTAQLTIPYVCCTYTNSFGTLAPDTFSSVSIDDQAEAYKAVSMLLDSGHRRIAMVLDSTEDHSISELRYMGYCRALRERGIEPDPALTVETGGFEMQAAYEGMDRFLKSGIPFTAVFAESDTMAVAAMKALHDHGKRVPEDCSVIAIDGIDMSAYAIPTLATLVQPQAELARNAVRILVDIIEGRGENRHMLLPTALRTGGSIRSL